MRICAVLPTILLLALAPPALASPHSQKSDHSRIIAHVAPDPAHRTLRSAAGPEASAPGFTFCGAMAMPPTALRRISRGFGHRHAGIDLMAPNGSPIRTAAAGTVIFAGWYHAYGNMVDIQHADGVITRYAHMSRFAPAIRAGAPVAANAIIGQVGATGRAHGAHVHFEVRIDGRATDPEPYLGLAGCEGTPRAEALEEARAPEDRPGPEQVGPN